MDYTFEDDIKLEARKTYLFFAYLQEKTGIYLIDAVEYGTREILQPSTNENVFRSMPDEKSLKVKNSITGEYESLESILDTYF